MLRKIPDACTALPKDCGDVLPGPAATAVYHIACLPLHESEGEDTVQSSLYDSLLLLVCCSCLPDVC